MWPLAKRCSPWTCIGNFVWWWSARQSRPEKKRENSSSCSRRNPSPTTIKSLPQAALMPGKLCGASTTKGPAARTLKPASCSTLKAQKVLFNSTEFIIFFLPLVAVVYFTLSRSVPHVWALRWLVVASVFFYGFWDPRYILLLLLSITANFIFGRLICKPYFTYRNQVLWIGVAFNIILLGIFKYTDFSIDNINFLFGLHLDHVGIILPLGISFFTFTQIAFLVDCYHDKVKNYSLTNYFLFVTYFPHLLAGPIIHHSEMMPQFDDASNKKLNPTNFRDGILLFSIGLFKKVALADTLAIWANQGFDNPHHMSFFVAWSTSLSYTFQLYFDFSGYTDMALGISKIFNIHLPINFNSPYKATSIQDFWRRWHITLSRFLRDYLYIPLGGNRKGESQAYFNIFLTFLLGGIWHGAGWTFAVWGILHGFGMIAHRLWQKTRIVMPRMLAWFVTFNFLNLGWVFFRAHTLNDALEIFRGMAGMEAFVLPTQILSLLPSFFRTFILGFGTVSNLADGTVMGCVEMTTFLIMSLLIVTLFNNSQEMSLRHKEIACVFILAFCLQKIAFNQVPSEFLYFRF